MQCYMHHTCTRQTIVATVSQKVRTGDREERIQIVNRAFCGVCVCLYDVLFPLLPFENEFSLSVSSSFTINESTTFFQES